jgi:NarL family two-component system response regulator LiaR
MRAGAMGYQLKDADPEDLVSAIRAAARGQTTLHPSVAARLVRGVDHSGEDSLADLSERQQFPFWRWLDICMHFAYTWGK